VREKDERERERERDLQSFLSKVDLHQLLSLSFSFSLSSDFHAFERNLIEIFREYKYRITV